MPETYACSRCGFSAELTETGIALMRAHLEEHVEEQKAIQELEPTPCGWCGFLMVGTDCPSCHIAQPA